MIFLDTTIWVGAIDASDQCHSDAKLVLEALIRGNLPPSITSDYVLNETLTILKRRELDPAKIVDAMNRILSSPRVEVLFIEETLFEESLPLYIKYRDLSFTDTVTLLLMKKYGMKDIYSHDSDFDKVAWIVRKEKP